MIQWHCLIWESSVPAIPVSDRASVSSIATVDGVSTLKDHRIAIKDPLTTGVGPETKLTTVIPLVFERLKISIEILETTKPNKTKNLTRQ